jgi:hypothetical protein
VWWLGLVVFMLLPAAWAFVTPYDGSYDEHDHVVRAAGVVRGQILVPPTHQKDDGGYQSVPASLVPPNFDCMRKRSEPATCLGTPPNDRTPRDVHTRAARYNPLYYAVVGWPLLPLPSMAGVILARLLNALLCAVILATALVTMWPLRRYRFMFLAMLLAVSPMVLSLNGLVNPNGVEIDAAILLWVALLRLLRPDLAGDQPPDQPPDTTADTEAAGRAAAAHERRRLVLRAIVAATVIVLARSEGIAVVAAICVFAAFALGARTGVRTLVRRADVRWGGIVVAASVLVSVLWSLVSKVADIGADAHGLDYSWSIVVRTILLGKFDFWLRQTVGLFGYGLIGLPIWVHVLWGVVGGTLVLGAFALCRDKRLAYTIVAIPVVCFLIGSIADMYMVRRVGYWMQGRYFLPLWVGMFFLAALALPGRALAVTALRRLYATGFLVWTTAIVFGLISTFTHFVDGNGPISYPKGWHPPAGAATPFLLGLAGIVATGALTLVYLRSLPRQEPAATG